MSILKKSSMRQKVLAPLLVAGTLASTPVVAKTETPIVIETRDPTLDGLRKDHPAISQSLQLNRDGPENGGVPQNEAQKQAMVKAAVKDNYIGEARQAFENLMAIKGEPGRLQESLALQKGIGVALDVAGADYSVIRPEEKKSNWQRRAEVVAAVKGAGITEARDCFRELQGITDEPDNRKERIVLQGRIKGALDVVHEDYSALDPKGQKTNAQMKKQVEALGMPAKSTINQTLAQSLGSSKRRLMSSAPS